jgi:hypothetical protein
MCCETETDAGEGVINCGTHYIILLSFLLNKEQMKHSVKQQKDRIAEVKQWQREKRGKSAGKEKSAGISEADEDRKSASAVKICCISPRHRSRLDSTRMSFSFFWLPNSESVTSLHSAVVPLLRLFPDSLRNDRDLQLPDVNVDIKNQTTGDAGQVFSLSLSRFQIEIGKRKSGRKERLRREIRTVIATQCKRHERG